MTATRLSLAALSLHAALVVSRQVALLNLHLQENIALDSEVEIQSALWEVMRN